MRQRSRRTRPLAATQGSEGDVSGPYSLVVVAGILRRDPARGQLRRQVGRLRFRCVSAPSTGRDQSGVWPVRYQHESPPSLVLDVDLTSAKRKVARVAECARRGGERESCSRCRVRAARWRGMPGRLSPALGPQGTFGRARSQVGAPEKKPSTAARMKDVTNSQPELNFYGSL